MGRRNNEQQSGSDRSKVRLFFVEVEGNNQSLQDVVRTFTATMNRPVEVARTLKRLPMTAAEQSNAGTPADTTLFDGDSDEFDGVSPEGTETIEEPVSPRQKRGQGPKIDRNTGIDLVGDLDFVPDGKPSLKTSFFEKSPSTDMEQVLVIAYYLQHTLELTQFGPSHILTAFKHVVVPVPVDLRATIRNIKKAKAWLSFSDLDNIRLTTGGENYVVHELPKAKRPAR